MGEWIYDQMNRTSTAVHGQPDSGTKSACVFSPLFIPRFPDIRSDNRAKAEDDAWAGATQFYNAYQETVVRELEQRQKSQRQASGWPRRRPIGATQGFTGSKRPHVERVGEGFDRRAQSSQPPVERASLQSAVSHAYYLVLLTLRTRRRTNSTLSSILLFKLPPSQKETSTDVSPISRIPSTREPSAAQGQPRNLRPRSRPTSLSGPRTRQSHATCFGRSHVSMRPAQLRRSVWWLAALCARYYALRTHL